MSNLSDLDVRIVRLEPIRVAAALGFGPHPEDLAWEQLLTWMDAVGMARAGAQFFGFNNPNPASGSPNYGYEQWVVLEPGSAYEQTQDANITFKTFEGGLYAVSRCQLANIEAAWQRLNAWQEDSAYRGGQHQWLEKAVSDQDVPAGLPSEVPPDVLVTMTLDLYLPIRE